MHGLLDMLFFYLFEPKSPNRFWEKRRTGDSIEYRLVNEEEIKRDVESVITGLGIKEGEYAVYGVYLFGSVFHNRKRPYFSFGNPHDVDIYVYMEKTDETLSRRIQEEISRVLSPRFNLPVQCLVFDHSPYDHYNLTGELPGLYASHLLYVRQERAIALASLRK
jgi:predicted nucleotidyltransferase